MNAFPTTPTRRQLDAMAARIAAGAEPGDLARWIIRVTGTDLPVEVLTAAASDLRDGAGDSWYIAADAHAAQVEHLRDRGGERLARMDTRKRAQVEQIVAEMREWDAAESGGSRWAEADDREIHPERGTHGPASRAAAQEMLRRAQDDAPTEAGELLERLREEERY